MNTVQLCKYLTQGSCAKICLKVQFHPETMWVKFVFCHYLTFSDWNSVEWHWSEVWQVHSILLTAADAPVWTKRISSWSNSASLPAEENIRDQGADCFPSSFNSLTAEMDLHGHDPGLLSLRSETQFIRRLFVRMEKRGKFCKLYSHAPASVQWAKQYPTHSVPICSPPK